MTNYKVSLYTYTQFLKENKTSRLSKFEKIYSGDPIPNINLPKLNEIFNSKVDRMDYQVKSIKNLNYPEELDYAYFFESKGGNKYRLDLVIIKEKNSILNDIRLHNKVFISVSFSKFDAVEDNYDDETNFNEIYDLLMRIKYIIDIHRNKIDESVYIFMFGQPEREEKEKMYKYFIKVCFPKCILIKDKTNGFPNINIGYYLTN